MFSGAAILNLLNSGGIAMYFILGLSIVALAIIVERSFVLITSYKVKDKYFQSLLRRLHQGDLRGAKSACTSTVHPLALIILSVLQNSKKGKSAMESAATVSFQKIAPKIQHRIGYLQMIGSVSTLIGLLGTIQGLIISFTSLAGASAAEKAGLLASGISTAMNTTAFGLIVAIPCILAYTFLSNTENSILGQYEGIVGEAIHILEHDLSEEKMSDTKRVG